MTRHLSNPEKVAILLFLVGEDAAAKILHQLAPDEVAQVGDAMAVMETIDKEICDQVLKEFSHLLDTRPGAVAVKNVKTTASAIAEEKSPVDDLLVDRGLGDSVRVQLSSKA